jgi:hypothetical protein
LCMYCSFLFLLLVLHLFSLIWCFGCMLSY